MSSVGRTSLRLAALALVARGVGFVVPMVLAAWFGVQLATDAFYFALAAPAVFAMLGYLAVGTLLVPALTERRARAPERLGALVGTAAALTAGAGASIGVATCLALPWLLPWVSGFDAEGRALVLTLSWALVPFQALVGAAAALRTGLEVSGGLLASGAGPLVRSVVQLVATGALLGLGPLALPLGLGAGFVAEVGWLLAALVREEVRPGWDPAELPVVRVALRGVGALALGEGLLLAQAPVDKAFASALPVGSVSVLEYADRVRLVPLTLLEASLLVAAYVEWARLSAAGDREGLGRSVARALTWVALLAPPVLAGLAVARRPLVALLFEHGAFDPAWSGPVADTLLAFLPGVWFALLGMLLSKAHVLAGRPGRVLGLGALSFALNAAGNALLGPTWGVEGLAAATTLATAVTAATSFALLRPAVRGIDALAVALATAASLAVAVVAGAPGLQDPDLWIGAVLLATVLAGSVGWISRHR